MLRQNHRYFIVTCLLVISLGCSNLKDTQQVIFPDEKPVDPTQIMSISSTPTIEVTETIIPSPTPSPPETTTELESLFIYNSAVLALRIEEYNDSANKFTQVIRRMPDLAIAYKGRAAAYYYDGRIELAKEDLQKALSLDVDLGGAHLYLGLIYKDEGDLQKAKHELTMAVNTIHPIRERWELKIAQKELLSIQLE